MVFDVRKLYTANDLFYTQSTNTYSFSSGVNWATIIQSASHVHLIIQELGCKYSI